jgi:GMP synthase (glutamine-hydrolysing)
MSLRALHIINEPSGPGGLFLPPLESRGFIVDNVDSTRRELPRTLAGYDAVISCGGTANTHETDVHPWIEHEIGLLSEALRDGIPVIGLCLGAQLLNRAAGGAALPSRPPEVGWVEVSTTPAAAADPLLAPAPPSFPAMQWHYYACRPPADAVELARNSTCVQAFRVGDVAWGTQFHIEVTREILLNWLKWAPDELARAGYTEERYLEALDRNLEQHEAIGRGMAERFADVAVTRAQNAA